jgi:hypothetical protein
VRITAAVAEQLLLLHEDADGTSNSAAALHRLAQAVTLAVPSCLSVTITLVRLGGDISVSTVSGAATPAPALASLAVPLSAFPAGDLLVLRAGAAGAFLLLADDLSGLLGPGRPPVELDKHLDRPPAPSSEEFAASLVDLSVVDQAVGVLVDRGLPPDAARRELWSRAGAAGTTVAAVSRDLLRSPRSDPGPI